MADTAYHHAWIHRTMLRDRNRCEAFRRALHGRLRPGDVVLDMGAGTGILSMLAAQAGARKVYAVECTGIVTLTRELVRANGLEEVVKVIHARMEDVDLPEPVDAIVSEWMGCLGTDENILPSVLVARDRHLKPGGALLPQCVRAWLAPIVDASGDEELAFWRSRPYGLDLSPMVASRVELPEYCRGDVGADALVAPGECLWEVRVADWTAERARQPFRGAVRFPLPTDTRISALAGWFDASFGTGDVLSTAPDAPPTCWGTLILPFRVPIRAPAGGTLNVQFSCVPVGQGYSNYEAAVSVGRGPISRHTWRYAATCQM